MPSITRGRRSDSCSDSEHRLLDRAASPFSVGIGGAGFIIARRSIRSRRENSRSVTDVTPEYFFAAGPWRDSIAAGVNKHVYRACIEGGGCCGAARDGDRLCGGAASEAHPDGHASQGGAGTLTRSAQVSGRPLGPRVVRSASTGKAPITLKGSGVLNYDDFGNLRMEIRADQASSDLLRAAGIDIRDGVISTDGRTAIDLQNRTLTYFLEGQPSSMATAGARSPRIGRGTGRSPPTCSR